MDIEKTKPHGGKRKGSGRKLGHLNKETIDAMAVKRDYQNRIRRNATKLFNAQFSLATGTQMLFCIHTDAKGVRHKPEMITDADTIAKFLDEDGGNDCSMDVTTYSDGSKCDDYFFLTTKLPDTRTITDMLDRSMGKPDATLDVTSAGEKIVGATMVFVDNPSSDRE